jgi:3-hydroxyisobutyrate dehydrogenase
MEPPMTAIPGSPSPVRPGGTRIGWIGVGVMGRSIVGRLLDAGFTVTLFSRRRESAEPLLARGAAWAGSPAAVAAVSDLVVTMVGYPEDVRQVVLGDDGVLAGVAQGGLLVDHTTSAPQLAVEIATAAAARGVWSLDAPVSGGDRGAREGTLTVMVGGDAGPRDALAAYWQVIARTVVPCGGPGAGQQTKLVNQIAIASGMIGMCEALVYAGKAGLDLPTTLAAIQPGAAGSWSLTNLAPRILAGDFAPGFMVDHILKDMRLAIDECRRMRLDLPGLALAESLYAALAARGGGRLGTQALVQVLGDLPVDGRASG